jgi:hypothetical protein
LLSTSMLHTLAFRERVPLVGCDFTMVSDVVM